MLQLPGFIIDCPDADGYGWRVYTDPVGHPFCLCRHEGISWSDGRVLRPSA